LLKWHSDLADNTWSYVSSVILPEPLTNSMSGRNWIAWMPLQSSSQRLSALLIGALKRNRRYFPFWPSASVIDMGPVRKPSVGKLPDSQQRSSLSASEGRPTVGGGASRRKKMTLSKLECVVISRLCSASI
jgi:hypothetical protein